MHFRSNWATTPSQNWEYWREAHHQKARHILNSLNQFPTKHSRFFQISDSKSSKLNSRALGKKLKHFEKKLRLFGFKTQGTASGSLHPTTMKVVKKPFVAAQIQIEVNWIVNTHGSLVVSSCICTKICGKSAIFHNHWLQRVSLSAKFI